MFKIETDQMNVPLALVRIPTPDAHTIGSPANPSPPRDPESHPTLLPAPILTPTTSARTSRRPEMLSSPPCSARGSPVKRCSPQVFRTPALPRQRAQPIQQTSSPPDSRAGSVGRGEVEETRLSSSAVKGHAAISLLGLKDDRR